jgi:hypothetical protein
VKEALTELTIPNWTNQGVNPPDFERVATALRITGKDGETEGLRDEENLACQL